MCYPKRRLVVFLGILLFYNLVLAAWSQEPEEVELTRIADVEAPLTSVEVIHGNLETKEGL